MLKKAFKRCAALLMVCALAVCAGVVPAFATSSDPVTADTVITGLTTGLTTAQGYAFQGISNALPLALGIAGVILAVTIGYRIYKRMSKG